jgi:hypothetical protein
MSGTVKSTPYWRILRLTSATITSQSSVTTLALDNRRAMSRKTTTMIHIAGNTAPTAIALVGVGEAIAIFSITLGLQVEQKEVGVVRQGCEDTQKTYG